jgi:palmitoyltransferase
LVYTNDIPSASALQCILKYDHHCPWIGQCVGARNHRFFILFNFWAALYTAFTLGLMISNLATRGTENLDPQWILITALSGLFFAFTFGLYATHCRLAVLNQTTVESLAYRDMQERENHHQTWRFWDRRQKRLSNEEWGRIGKEGNLWWKDGGWRENWEETMGTKKLGWICKLHFPVHLRMLTMPLPNAVPIGRPDPQLGLSYSPNPRFDSYGRWMRRRDWPAELKK